MSRHPHRPAQTDRRRDQFVAPSRTSKLPLRTVSMVVAGLVFLGVVVYVVATRQTEVAGAGAGVTAPGGDVRLDTAQFDDGQARFYRYTSADGRDIRFFVLKSADGVIRAAFDTCDVCYRARKGYRQVWDTMVCNNCGQTFRSVDVNALQGGCNPVPLDRVSRVGNWS